MANGDPPIGYPYGFGQSGDECTSLHPLQAISDAPIVSPSFDLDAMRGPIDYASKCKRRRADGPTPCLCCPGECYGAAPSHELQGTGYDSGASGYELQGRRSAPRQVVAFTGLAGSGKSTAALHLVAQGWQRVRFAGPLKDMMRALGLTEREIEGDRKEQPCELLGGCTPRKAMQTIGTEWGRNIIATDLWIRAWRAALDRVPSGVNVVVDDCRFPNEGEAVRAAGGGIIQVMRPGAGAGAAGHSSEAHDIPAMATVHNGGSMSAFLDGVDVAVRHVSWALAALN